MRKCYLVASLPKDDAGNMLEIDTRNLYEDWSAALDALQELVYQELPEMELTKYRYPRTVSIETPTSRLQIWVCNIPYANNEM